MSVDEPAPRAVRPEVLMGDRELDGLRRHGFGVAYRMLGSAAEADDVVQEALLGLTRQPGPIQERAELADSPSLALLVVLERLWPVERAAYLLREVFGYEYAHIATIIEQTEVNSRQLVTRARRHLAAHRPRFDADEAAREVLRGRFLAAAQDGDLEALEALLAKDALVYADSGGKAMAPPESLVGAGVIARFMAAVAQARPAGRLQRQRRRLRGQGKHQSPAQARGRTC